MGKIEGNHHIPPSDDSGQKEKPKPKNPYHDQTLFGMQFSADDMLKLMNEIAKSVCTELHRSEERMRRAARKFDPNRQDED